MALVNQQTGARQGNANYVLYPLSKQANATCASAANPASTCIFYDIPAGSNNSVACQGGTPNCSNTSTASTAFGIMTSSGSPAFNTAAGFDPATGLGSVNVTNLLGHWTAASSTPSTTTFVLNSGTAVANKALGTAILVTGTVTGTGGTPTGFVELILGTTVPGTVIDTFAVTNGSYSGMTAALPATTTGYQVVAHYGGGASSTGTVTFGGSTSSAQSVTSVSKANSTVQVGLVLFDANGNPLNATTAASTLVYGVPYILRVDVSNGTAFCLPPPVNVVPSIGSTFPCPTGTVTLLDKGTALNDFLVPHTSTATNTAALNNFGFAEDQPIQLPGGSHTITASYTANSTSSFNSQATSNTLSITITAAATQTGVSASPATTTAGGTVMLTALVIGPTSNGAGPTGTVQFKNGSSNLSTPVTCAAQTAFDGTNPPSCTATMTTTSLSLMTPPSGWNRTPRLWVEPLGIVATVMILLFFLSLKYMPTADRRRYACAAIVLLAMVVAGVAGCGGGSGGGGGGGGTTGHTDSITAVFTSGDTNYSGSTSSALAVTVN